MYDNPAYVTLQPFAYIFLQLGKMGQKRGRRVVYGQRTSYWAIHLFPGAGVWGLGGGERRWLVDLVLMLEQKTMRKGTFFKLGSAQCFIV